MYIYTVLVGRAYPQCFAALDNYVGINIYIYIILSLVTIYGTGTWKVLSWFRVVLIYYTFQSVHKER